eukprot:12818630-Alexandrium_andersonii.AAC.1
MLLINGVTSAAKAPRFMTQWEVGVCLSQVAPVTAWEVQELSHEDISIVQFLSLIHISEPTRLALI